MSVIQGRERESQADPVIGQAITCTPVLSDKQRNLLTVISTWPGGSPMHISDLRRDEHLTLDSLKRLGLVSGRCVLRATQKGRALSGVGGS